MDALHKSRTVSARDVVEFRSEARRIRRTNRRDAGDYDGAIADDQAMMALLPDFKSDDLRDEAEIEARKGNIDRALTLFSQAVDAAPDADHRHGALVSRAFVLAKAGRLAEAHADLEKALVEKPFVVGRDGDKRADLFAALGNYDAAVKAYKRDEDAGTSQTAAYAYLRSFVEAARGNFPDAAAAIRAYEAQQLNNASVVVLSYLARARSGETDKSSLASAAPRFNANKWPDAAIYFALGKIDADQLLARAAFGNPRVERSQLAIANLYVGEMALISGDKDAARTALTKAATYCSENAVAQACLWAKGELSRM